MIIGSSNRHGISNSPVSMTRWHELKLQEMLSLFVPLLYWKNTLEKINSFGKNVEFYMACPIISIKLNNFETTDGLFGKFVIGDVIFIILLTLLMVTTSGSRGGRTRRAPPLTAADLWFFYAQNAIFSQFFLRSLPSRLILSISTMKIWPKTR